MTLMIDDAVIQEKIKRGKPIACGAGSEPGDMAVTAWFRMPGSRYVSLHFPEKEKKNEDGEATAATDDENASGEITWPQDQARNNSQLACRKCFFRHVRSSSRTLTKRRFHR